MDLLYDSDDYVVVYIPYGPAEKPDALEGYEIVDKTRNVGIFLHGDWAAAFERQIEAWKVKTPHQADVERVLAQYTKLATNPLIEH